jgi:CRP-like cAMP-binding protein
MSLSDNGSEGRVTSDYLYTLDKFRQTDFFSDLSPEAVKVIAFLCTRESYKPGDTIFHQDDDDGCAYYITRGEANLLLQGREGTRTVRTLGPDTFLGAVSLLTPMVRKFTLTAETEVDCLVMSRKKFTRVLDQFPDITLKIVTALGNKLTEAENTCIRRVESGGRDAEPLLGVSLL